MNILNRLREILKQYKTPIFGQNLTMFLSFVAFSTVFWPVPDPFKNMALWGFLFASFIVFSHPSVHIDQVIKTVHKNAIVMGMVIFYAMSIAKSHLSPPVNSIYILALLFVATLWISPISPISLINKEKTIKISDWFIVVFTAIYIVSFELINYYIL